MKYIDNLDELKFSEIIKLNRELGSTLTAEKKYDIALISNVTLNPLKDILEFFLRHNQINAHVTTGDYDNFIQNTMLYHNSNCLIYFWEIGNLISGFHYKADVMSSEDVRQLVEKTKAEIQSCLDLSKNAPLILFNKFSALSFNFNTIEENNLDAIADELNSFLKSLNLKNLLLINTDKILVNVGVENAISMQHYYNSKTLYTVKFFKYYSEFIAPVVLSGSGKVKKALVLDCDNTLWKGIIGENGIDGINCSNESYQGEPFYEAQALFKKLANQGIILALCSKNNPDDVEIVLNQNAKMLLQQKDIVTKKVNWNPKTQNLQEIANELNINIDSLAFIDDSEFEINLVKETIPAVSTFLVPARNFEYPKNIKKFLNMFFQLTKTNEDKQKAQMYHEQTKREHEKKSFENIDDYLKNLKLRLNSRTLVQEEIPRLSQLTLKTNQFNTTTRRYSEAELQNFYDRGDILISYKLEDKYGDYGIIGFMMVQLHGDRAILDTFLMSCRAIGRQVEFAMFEVMMKALKEKGIKTLEASIIKNAKNIPVHKLYDELGLKLINNQVENTLQYEAEIDQYNCKHTHFVELL